MDIQTNERAELIEMPANEYAGGWTLPEVPMDGDIPPLMGELAMLATWANMRTNGACSLHLDRGKHLELSCWDQAAGRMRYIVGKDTRITAAVLEDAIMRLRVELEEMAV